MVLVRYGSTVLNAEDRFAGATGVELTAEGRAQAGRLVDRLDDVEIAAVYCSPIERTLETVTIIAKPHGLTPIPRDWLREINHGWQEGLRRAKVDAQFSAEHAAWEACPFTFTREGGESRGSVMARVRLMLFNDVSHYTDQPTRCHVHLSRWWEPT
jgi:probable phosphoglycerate mutase